MIRRIISVDIGAYSIKCAILKKIGQEYCFHKKEEYLLPETLTHKSLGSVLRNFAGKSRITFPLFSFSLPYTPPEMTALTFKMPKLNAKEMKKSMSYEIESRLLFQELSDVVFGWDIVGSNDDEYQTFAVVLARDVVNQIVSAQKHLGWATGRIEPQVVSLGRLLGNQTCAVIDFGHAGTRVMVYRDGMPVSVQNIDIGGEHLTESIRNMLKHENDDADPVMEKHTYGAMLQGLEGVEDNPRTLRAAKAISRQAQTLCAEVKQVLRATEVKENLTLDSIYYVGGAAKLRYLADYFSTELQRDFIPLCLDNSDEDNKDHLYTMAGASWLYRNHSYMDSINFLQPAKMRFRPDKALVALVSFLLVAQVGLYILHQQTDKKLLDYGMLQKTNYEMQELVKGKINTLHQEIAEYKNLSVLLGAIDDVKVWASSILYELPSRTPDGIQIDKIQMKNQQEHIVIAGKAYTYSDIGFFAIKLEELGQINLKSIEEEEDTGLQEFEIHLVQK